MDEHPAIGWGFKFLRAVLAVLILAAAVFIVFYVRSHIPPDMEEGAREQLELLSAAYDMRTEDLGEFFRKRIDSAPNEVLSIKYQQEKNEALENAKDLYFADRAAVVAGRREVLREHWSAELDRIDPEEIRARMLE